jgi:hypothetical protein
MPEIEAVLLATANDSVLLRLEHIKAAGLSDP